MKQVCVIHGGSTYDSDADFLTHLEQLELDYKRLLYRPRWNNWLAEILTDYDVLLPSLPNNANAKYSEWSVYFSKIIPFLTEETVLVGHSLGGIFLAKYLNEHANSLHFKKVALIAAPFDDETGESLGSFRLPQDMSHLAKTADGFHLYQSKDDVVVPVAEIEKYKSILPNASMTLFEDRGHLNTPTFQELVEFIKK